MTVETVKWINGDKLEYVGVVNNTTVIWTDLEKWR
jgi:hypothetical protein